ncbi:hypothetical protein [Halospeciosus flavus]|uniref:hypothetical protein n=1 Tax=Halospeciosus flavus TaxID=3032283 RepID=UPI00361D34CE
MHLTTILTDIVDDLRRPEYTGSNRCVPCTVVNLMIALGLAGAIAVAGSLSAGVGVFLIAVAAIYVRGYLVPGTPTLTKRYLPDSVLRWFEASHPQPNVDEDFDITATLDEFGLLVDNPDGDVQLDPEFAAAWFERMTARDVYVPQLDDLATLLDVDVEQLDVRYHGNDACTVYLEDQWLGQWESAAAFNADVTAEALLAERYPEWAQIPLVQQGNSSLPSGSV